MTIIENQNRPDIAAGLDKQAIAGAATLITPKIFPSVVVGEKAGKLYAAKVITGGGQKNRTKGNAVSAARVEAVETNYSVDSYEGRDIFGDEDIKDAGGVENAIVAGARGAAYDAFKLYETDGWTTLSGAFAGNSYDPVEITTSAAFANLAEAADKVKRYGKPLLVCSETFIRDFVKIPDVRETLTTLYAHDWFKDIRDLGTVNPGLGLALGVDSVLIGDDTMLPAEAASAAYVVGYREEAKEDARNVIKRLPSLGYTAQFLPEENSTVDQPFAVSQGYLPTTKDCFVDVDYWAQPVVANKEAVAKVTL